MFDVGYKVDGAKELQRRLDRVNLQLEDVVDKALGDGLGELVETHLYGMENYAPPPPNSRYVRTGTLGRGYGVERRGRGSFSIINAVRYRIFVVGDRFAKGQAWMHRGRWWLARRRIEEHLPETLKAVNEAIRDFVEKGRWA